MSKKGKEENDLNPFKWIWHQMKGYRLLMFSGLILVLAGSAVTMVNPYISGIIVDSVILDGKVEILTRLLLIMVGATLFRAIVRYSFQMIFEYVSQSVLYKVRVEVYSRVQKLDFNFFDKTPTGDIMARMTGDTETIRHFVAWVIYNIVENAAVFIFAITMLFTINVKFALLLLAVAPFTAFFTYKLAKEVKPTFFAIREQFSKLNSVVQQNISGNRVVKAFAKEDYEIEKFEKENREFRQKNIESANIWQKYLPVIESLAGVLSVIMILVGGIMVIRGHLTLGALVTFNSYIWALNNPMRMSGWLINDVQRFAASAEKVLALIQTESQIKNSDNFIERKVQGKVEFRNVSFSYGEEQVLDSINLTVMPGQTIAVIGPTGSGKSTLANLICRFYDCTEGELLIDDVNIRDMSIRKLRESIGVAMQDIFLFSDTIEGNIAYGVPDASMAKIMWAASTAGANDFIRNMPEGYDTIVGERGVGLSGGQKQRIALARALLKNPSILILDDTTSSVDMETEHAIHSMLKSVYKDKTSFIIAHRISSVKHADQILVLDNGRVVEQGKHDELLKKKGYYYSVFVNQFGDFDNVYNLEVV